MKEALLQSLSDEQLLALALQTIDEFMEATEKKDDQLMEATKKQLFAVNKR